MENDISLISILAFSTLLPFVIASGTCYIKFSIVFVMVRNALGLQQIPSNMTLNGVALLLASFVMMPIVKNIYEGYKNAQFDVRNLSSVIEFVENGLDGYRSYLVKYADPELTQFFEKAASDRKEEDFAGAEEEKPSIFALLPAYALSEIKSAFKIGFYIYLPFVVVDLLISSILLALGMMMMSPVTISVPIKLVLFVVLDGWTLISKGMILQYMDLAGASS
ncbi:EscR/YscR/HrcR family type III secretion system export apparatus protein [Candidatus Williamhamiltonella defendens]|uniref:EscR/YscR/HrcR family type III secretion system export apparatus protein n=2 Tax=Candidatus Williamhamiltonella defendens TaxID=138072 RepID=A0A249E0L5_9ENTR|nr:EscR/YscR/HrcR family type III secretion system export apparatus protein [Candidatus Hamiltonella defensa]ASX26880.1 EscR/YscR/HrcR family type III secretion system export apparatus protein [Candidatus Hamiltonella defensa (Bemisia tabaci)]CED79711.1 Surface presentation of antigens protein SpaP [Candidatus Hamiltonella defensa (Bemisia tabaci)]